MRRLEEITIGERLKTLRERRQMSQQALADESGIGAAVISRYERDVMTPGWKQIEKILLACDASPCDLFEDYCVAISGADDSTFEVVFYDPAPADPNNVQPTRILQIGKSSPIVLLMGIVPTDKRYAITRIQTDMMVPDIYPGDLVITDTALEPKSGRIIAGYWDGERAMGRLTRHQKRYYLVFSNRHYPSFEFDPEKWQHIGCIINASRDLTRHHIAGVGFVDESSDVISIGGGGVSK